MKTGRHQGKAAAGVVLKFWAGLLLGLLSSVTANAGVEFRGSRIGDASHLEFSGATEWDYRVDRISPKQLRLQVPELSQEAKDALKSFTDHQINSVQTSQNAPNGRTELILNLREEGLESFDYTTPTPSRLVVDIFPRAPEVEQKSKPKASDRSTPEGTQRRSRRAGGSRQPANDLPMVQVGPLQLQDVDGGRFGLFDGGDPEFRRFRVLDAEVSEKSIIASRNNIYIRFPMLQVETPHLEALVSAAPIYEIEKRNDPTNEEARVLLVLFQNKRHAVFLRSAREFLERNPKSPYDEILRYMIADTHFAFYQDESLPTVDEAQPVDKKALQEAMLVRRRNDFENAMAQYRAVTERYPDSPLLGRTLLLMSFSYLDRGDSFNALKTLQRFKRIQPDSPHMDKVDLAIADSFLRLARYDEAREALKDIESRSKRRSTQAEAAYRLGDVDYRQSRFVEAEKSYIRAADTYPDFRSRFPNAAYNTAEGQFERKEYRAAIDAYVAFMRAFPAHPHTAYALTRVGELLEILSGDQRRAMGAYIENQFRNPSHPGSLVSRIRLLTARFPKFKDKELEAALESVTKAADDLQKDENFIDVKELTTIVIADGLTARGDFERANSLLIGQFQANPQSVHGTKFQSRIAQNLTSQISQAVDKGDWLSALRVHSRNQESWLRSANRIDSEFLAARAYEMAGVMDPAFEAYQRIVDRLAQLQGSDELKAREVFERLPTLIEARTRLAQVQYQRGQFQQAQETLERDSGKESPAVAESLLAERADLSAALAERKGQVDVGIRYLRELIGKWRKDDPSAERLRFRLARLLKESKKAEAMKEADEILSQIVAATPKDKALLADALQMQADLAVEQKQSSKAMSALEALVNLQEADGRAVGSARYRLGLLQFEAGQVKAAEGTWGRLDPTRDRIWKGLAQDQMSSERWRSEYDKYIRRIPAATSLQGGSRE